MNHYFPNQYNYFVDTMKMMMVYMTKHIIGFLRHEKWVCSFPKDGEINNYYQEFMLVLVLTYGINMLTLTRCFASA